MTARCPTCGCGNASAMVAISDLRLLRDDELEAALVIAEEVRAGRLPAHAVEAFVHARALDTSDGAAVDA